MCPPTSYFLPPPFFLTSVWPSPYNSSDSTLTFIDIFVLFFKPTGLQISKRSVFSSNPEMHLNTWKTCDCLLGGLRFMSPRLPVLLFSSAWLQGPSYGSHSVLDIRELRSFLAYKWFPLLLPCFQLYWRFAAIIQYSSKFLMFGGYTSRSEAGHSLRTRCIRM